MTDGIIVINKQAGMTSHDVVSFIRRKLNMRRVGHAGTLDPMATGVLIILLGRTTKLFQRFVGFDKAYRATLQLGLTTTTADIQGKTIREAPFEKITSNQLEEIFGNFVGDIQQIPPMVSAIKVKGQKLYQLARRGIEVERPARSIRIDVFKLLQFSSPYAEFYVECSKGTYIRQLAQDVGEVLGCGACISQIERIKVGPFRIEGAVTLEAFNENHIRSWQDGI